MTQIFTTRKARGGSRCPDPPLPSLLLTLAMPDQTLLFVNNTRWICLFFYALIPEKDQIMHQYQQDDLHQELLTSLLYLHLFSYSSSWEKTPRETFLGLTLSFYVLRSYFPLKNRWYFLGSQNHGMVWVGEDIKTQIPNPCSGPGTRSTSPGCSNTALNTCRDGISAVSLTICAPHQHPELRKSQNTHIWIDIIKKVDFI